MTDAPPNPAQVPKTAAKGVKGLSKSLGGHPKWVYAVVIVGAIALAYTMRQRANAKAQESALITGPDDSGNPYGSYDASAYPGGTQGASYFGSTTPGDENNPPDNGEPRFTPDQFAGLLATFLPLLGGGGPPNLPADVHAPPTAEVPFYTPAAAPEPPPVYAPPPPPPAPPPPSPVPIVVSSSPQPILGPGIFYNEDRRLRYIVQNKKTDNYPKGHNFRGYESHLNRGDWGGGGWIPV